MSTVMINIRISDAHAAMIDARCDVIRPKPSRNAMAAFLLEEALEQRVAMGDAPPKVVSGVGRLERAIRSRELSLTATGSEAGVSKDTVRNVLSGKVGLAEAAGGVLLAWVEEQEKGGAK